MKPFEQRGCAVLKRLPANAVAAEIGVLRGMMSEYLLRNHPTLKLFMVDSWQTAEHHPEHYRATGDVHANHTDPARVASHRREAEGKAKHYPGRAIILPVASVEAAQTVRDGSLDLVFIDADHSYQGAKADLAAWVPKVKPGGWIGGHDYRNTDPAYDFSGVDRAVNEWASAWGVVVEEDANFTWWSRL